MSSIIQYNKENNEAASVSSAALEAANAQLREENKGLAHYALGYDRRFEMTGPDHSPVYCEGSMSPDVEYYCEFIREGEFDKWWIGKKSVCKGGIPLSVLPFLEYHIEGLKGPIRTNKDMGHDLEYEVSIDESFNTCYIRQEHPILELSIKISTFSWDELTGKLADRWKINEYSGGRLGKWRTAKLKLNAKTPEAAKEASDALGELFGQDATFSDYTLHYDMNEAGWSRFEYDKDGIKFDDNKEEAVVNDKKQQSLSELQEENTRLKEENNKLLRYKFDCHRDIKLTGRNGTPVYWKGDAGGDGAFSVSYTVCPRWRTIQPSPKAVPLLHLAGMTIHVEGEKWMNYSIDDLDATECKLTLSHEGKLSLTLIKGRDGDDFYLHGDVTTKASFGALNDLPSEWRFIKKNCYGKPEANYEFSLYNMDTTIRKVLQGDTKARAVITKLRFHIGLFRGYDY